MPSQSFLDPVVIAQLGNLSLRARRILDGLYAGHHQNKNRGHSQDFSEHRPYNPGDDLRSLDWKVFGRTDRLAVKQFEEQTNVGATVFLDHSASMGFSWAGRISKLEYAKTMAAAIGYLVVAQHDAIGLIAHSQHLPPGSQLGHLNRFFEVLGALEAQGRWDTKAIGSFFGTVQKKRGFVIVFSDLMENEEETMRLIRAIQARKNEVLIFQILDPAEKDLPFQGPTLFEDMETGDTLRTDPEALQDHYRKWVAQRLANFSSTFRSAGVDYTVLTTDMSFDKGLGAYLSWRGERF